MLENMEPPLRRHADWFDENNKFIQSLLQEMIFVRNEMFNTGLRSKIAKFKECKRKNQAYYWWNRKAEAIQDFAECGYPRAYNESLKEIYGPVRHSVTFPFFSKPGTVLLTKHMLCSDGKSTFRISSIDHFQLIKFTLKT